MNNDPWYKNIDYFLHEKVIQNQSKGISMFILVKLENLYVDT